MSWVPRDLANYCVYETTVTTCLPQTYIFLQLVVSLFGFSRDAQPNFANFDAPQFFGDGSSQREEYDFIVVGAGSAGCVVANRLSEISQWTVLLLEAGGEEPDVADVPAFAPMLQRSSIDWGYQTQPSPRSCLARDDGRCNWARGRVMGGSSTINYMIYIRGHPRDYDEWEEELGNPGWSYANVLPYFRKSEDNRNPEEVDSFSHGTGGYLTVQHFSFQDENTIELVRAYQQLGLEYVDQNSGRQLGTMLLQFTTRDGERLSTNGAFIRPIRQQRVNLVVRPDSQATRVLIDPRTKTAYGVEYLRNGRLVQAIARKEVILSAGAINSPVLLMLSGVGPTDHLQEHGIEVIKDLAVGFNLHDHVTIDGPVFEVTNLTSTLVSEEERARETYFYRDTRSGPLASIGTLQGNAFVQTRYENEFGRPDIQYSVEGANVQNFFTDPVLTYNTAVLPLSFYNGMMVRPILLNPASRGRILLNDTDPVFGAPLIFANTFTQDIDLLRMVEGIKQALTLEDTESFQRLGIRLVRQPLPACEHLAFGSDDYWACIAMSYTTTIFHPVGTCKMGPPTDVAAVVDPRLRVYGIRNLRVIDASIMPRIVRGNTNAPVIMIGELGSDFIKDTWLGRE